MTYDIDQQIEDLKALPEHLRNIAIRYIVAGFIYSNSKKNGTFKEKYRLDLEQAQKEWHDIKDSVIRIKPIKPLNKELINHYKQIQREKR